jgi:hypothetical protein
MMAEGGAKEQAQAGATHAPDLPAGPDPLVLSQELLAHEHELAPGPAEKLHFAPDVRRRYRDRYHDRALGFRLLLVLLVFAVVAAGLSLKVRPLSLPLLVVAEVEERMNRLAGKLLPGVRISLGGIEVMLDGDWAPVLALQDLRLLQGGGSSTLLALPAASVTMDRSAALSGKILPTTLSISGAHVDLTRDLEGKISLALGTGNGPAIASLGDLFDRIDAALAQPELAELETVVFEALSLTLYDERQKRAWELGDGRLVAENREEDLAAELTISVLGASNARARVTAVAAKGADQARVSAEVSDVQTADLAAQHPVLAWLAALDAPMSGQFSVQVDRDGITALNGALALGEGALRPSTGARPIGFTRAGLKLAYDLDEGRLRLSDITLLSPTARVTGFGQLFLLDQKGQILRGTLSGRAPAAYLGQLTLSDVEIDPVGLFEAPVVFSHGSLDLRLTAEPFLLEVGQFTLTEGARKLTLSGSAGAAIGGWSADFDMAMNRVSVAKLMQLWPLTLVPKTRAWAENNLLTGDLTDVNGAIRLVPGAEPILHLDYDFADAEIRVLPDMPPIQGALGYSAIDAKTNVIVLSKGTLTPPEGGVIDLAGTTVKVADITRIPAVAEVSLRGTGPMVAMLSVLDQKPFEYLKKAGRDVALGQGEATVRAEITTPLARAMPEDISFSAEGVVRDFSSSVLLEGRVIALPKMSITADNTGLKAGGPGTIDGLPFDVVYDLPFSAASGKPATVTGTVEISPRTVEVFDLGLPKGMVRGTARGRVTIALPRAAPPQMSLTSDLQGATLAIPELGWTKSAGARASLEVEARLSTPPDVSRLTFSGAGLEAAGRVDFKSNGRLDVARFARVKMGRWLDGAVEIRGSDPLSFAVTSGSIDFRYFPNAEERSGGPSGGASTLLALRLSEFRVTDTIRVTDFRGDFALGSNGASGQFAGNLGGSVPINGGVTPSNNGTRVRVVTDNAGAALTAAGIFSSARGGAADLVLTPRKKSGVYDGRANFSEFRLLNDNVLAELLNAVSVVGLLEQLNGTGIVFNQAEADFLLTPSQVTIKRASAVGASMGVSLEGTYQTSTGALRMGGVLSPIYLLNGIGAVLTRRGEGLFGFSFRLNGTADNPEIGVNPLSILTPGMFREIFRLQPPPKPGNSN